MRAAILPILVLWTHGAAATEPLPAVESRTDYSEFRIALALQGWKPDRQAKAREKCVSGRTRICETYAETISCQRTTPSRCLFLWNKNQTQIEIETVGSKPQVIKVEQMRCRAGCLPEEPSWPTTDR
ncbi:hypothetical protein M446_5184 [Methylobacterium sp. 4-46]|uniref:hypothetical protein n=1 Tax=unclassified Methylobacterium TaxID=2615210 RepID=UPI000152BE59|nr:MULTISPECIES: hypothetical protein [Methylobacterium]ACA19509.1 hypothetical protein M446_5184 [Methylobacterium sp. 4-46]WFT78705.1 hypothetical protein QA634_26075 [Methylobacterium nodulans]